MSILSPTRKADVAAIVAVIESGDYESSEEMAKAIYKVATDLVLDREWYVAVLGSAIRWGYGLFPGKAAAEKACIVGPAAVVKVYPGVKFLESAYGPELGRELIERGD